MIGDAPGDLKAAKANDALFYPINPGDEVASWKRFHDEAMDKFFDGTYAGRYEKKLIEEFDSHCPRSHRGCSSSSVPSRASPSECSSPKQSECRQITLHGDHFELERTCVSDRMRLVIYALLQSRK